MSTAEKVGYAGTGTRPPHVDAASPPPADSSSTNANESAAAGFARALLRGPRALAEAFTRIPLQPLRKKAAALVTDRISQFSDIAEHISVRGGVKLTLAAGIRAAGSVTAGLAASTLAGTILFGSYETTHRVLLARARGDGSRALTPFAAGAIAGACHGVVMCVASSLSAGGSVRERLSGARSVLLRSALADALEWSVALGVFSTVRRHSGASTNPDDDDGGGGGGVASITADNAHITPADVVSLGVAATTAAAAQTAIASRVSGAPFTGRAVATAALGLVAFELSGYLDS